MLGDLFLEIPGDLLAVLGMFLAYLTFQMLGPLLGGEERLVQLFLGGGVLGFVLLIDLCRPSRGMTGQRHKLAQRLPLEVAIGSPIANHRCLLGLFDLIGHFY